MKIIIAWALAVLLGFGFWAWVGIATTWCLLRRKKPSR